MRRQLVKTESVKIAQDECPWACVMIAVEGGIMCFESWDDYKTWENQV